MVRGIVEGCSVALHPGVGCESLAGADADPHRRRHAIPSQHPGERQRFRQARASRHIASCAVDRVHAITDLVRGQGAPVRRA